MHSCTDKNLDKYTIPTNYQGIFDGRFLLITGVGRSGTTILGKVIGSMKPVFYLFEPAMMRLVPFLYAIDDSQRHSYSKLLKALLFEDYVLQLVHGRNLNYNQNDSSYIGNYLPQTDIEDRWERLSRRNEAVEYLRTNQVMIAVKIPTFQTLCSTLGEIISGAKFIHIIRNGSDVIASALRQGWYTDIYMNSTIVDWVEHGQGTHTCNIPYYLDEESRVLFPTWNQVTRAACVWRCLTESGLDFYENNQDVCFQLKYEDFIDQPEYFVLKFEDLFGLERTPITEKHLQSIKSHKPHQHSFLHQELAEPERSKFVALMQKLGYQL